MGLIRKAMSVSTLGAVKFTSRREAQTKQAIAAARLANEQARTLREQNTPAALDAPDLPWWRQPTLGSALSARRQGPGEQIARQDNEPGPE